MESKSVIQDREQQYIHTMHPGPFGNKAVPGNGAAQYCHFVIFE